MKMIAKSSHRNARCNPSGIWKLSGSFLLATAVAFGSSAWAAEQAKPATDATKAANDTLLKALPFNDKTSFELAHKGFIAPLPSEPIKGPNGNMIWDPSKYGFIKEGTEAPATTNPSLWRQSQLINISGLFEVTVNRPWFPRHSPSSGNSVSHTLLETAA